MYLFIFASSVPNTMMLTKKKLRKNNGEVNEKKKNKQTIGGDVNGTTTI